jgi:sortase (surface protein transpeptidase)
MKALGSARSRLTIVLIAAALIVGMVSPLRAKIVFTSASPSAGASERADGSNSGRSRRPALPVPKALTAAGLSLYAGPVAVPLQLRMPSIGITAPMVGVGVTPKNAMDAPEGPLNDPVWQQAFWYRGSAIPGAPSTALIAGHIDGPRGSTAVFGHVEDLRPGDPIIVHDTRTGFDVHFTVTGSLNYSLAQTTSAAVLKRIYGTGPVAGTKPQRSADGLAHLSLVTCSGTFVNGTHDHRLVVFATRTD